MRWLSMRSFNRNFVGGNLKTAIRCTYHIVKFAKYVPLFRAAKNF